MEHHEREAKLRDLQQAREQVRQLEQELASSDGRWEGDKYYATYYATAGFMLGMFGAMSSLLLNIVGSVLVQQHPLRLIQVYLTWPLGERALELGTGLTLTVGCCLYIGTGMLLGIPFHMLLTRFTFESTVFRRFVFASCLAISMWIVHYYLILAWLQPLLFGGNWIVELIPWWVGSLTHLAFGWTMAAVYPLGLYRPYRLQTEY